jgi:hypothetical protein
MFYTMLKIKFLFVVDVSRNKNFFYHNLDFLFDIFSTRICLYSEFWLRICVYNLQQHIKNDTDSTDVVENDYIHIQRNVK